jgi:hypothetical protein
MRMKTDPRGFADALLNEIATPHAPLTAQAAIGRA